MIENKTPSQITEKPNMPFSNLLLNEIPSYPSDPMENENKQNALITFALYICINTKDHNGYHHIVDKTMDLVEKSNLFDASPENIIKRIYKHINLFRITSPDLLFPEAVKILPEELRKITFDWAIELLTGDVNFTSQNPVILSDLAKKFGYQNEEVKEMISTKLGQAQEQR